MQGESAAQAVRRTLHWGVPFTSVASHSKEKSFVNVPCIVLGMLIHVHYVVEVKRAGFNHGSRAIRGGNFCLPALVPHSHPLRVSKWSVLIGCAYVGVVCVNYHPADSKW